MDFAVPLLIVVVIAAIGIGIVLYYRPQPTKTTDSSTIVYNPTRYVPYYYNNYPYHPWPRPTPQPTPRPDINHHGIPAHPVPGRLY